MLVPSRDLRRSRNGALQTRSAKVSSGLLSSEKGNSIIEFCFCFPFVFLVFICSVDIGRALNQYFTITRIVYEGARFAGTVVPLEVAAYSTAGAASTAPAPGHLRVRARVDLLLQRYQVNMATLPVNYLTTERIQPVGQRDQVRISLRIPFEPIFPLFRGLLSILGSAATGPYLVLAGP